MVGVVWLLLGNQSQNNTGSIYTVQRGSISSVVHTTGSVQAARSIQLSFQVAQVVQKVYVQPGDFVPAGTLLMQLDPTTYQQQLDSAMAQRDIVRFQFSGSQEKAQATASIQPSPTPTPYGAPTATVGVPADPSDLYAQAEQENLAEQNVRDAQARLAATKLYAPFDGTVMSVQVQEGQNVGQGQPTITLSDLTKLQVSADIDEIDVANVSAGQKVQFTLDAFPGQTFTGTVQTISPGPVQKQGSTIYPALINFATAPKVQIRPGMAANLSITSSSKDNIIVVPTRAIRLVGPNKYVDLVTGNNQTTATQVQTGVSDGSNTEIISGLQAGQQIKVPS